MKTSDDVVLCYDFLTLKMFLNPLVSEISLQILICQFHSWSGVGVT